LLFKGKYTDSIILYTKCSEENDIVNPAEKSQVS